MEPFRLKPSSVSSSTLEIQTPKAFAPLLSAARYKGAWGGRGSGKSHFFGELMVEAAILKPGFRGVCIREVQKSLKESSKRLIEDKIGTLGVGRLFDIQKEQINTPGGGLILFQGMQDHTAESIKSLEGFDVAWVEEAQTLSGRSLEMLRPTIRSPGSELWFGWNPRSPKDPVDQLLRGQNPPPGAIVVKANFMDNPFFPKELEDERDFDRKHKPDRYAHIWLGDYEPTSVGAIWDRATLHEQRRAEPPEMNRIVVAIDVAVSDGPEADEHGIIVCGIGSDRRGYVLDDGSLHGSPRRWAERAIALYDRWNADALVIEVNQGGDMVRHTIESIRRGIRIIEVRATRGKHVRAEPISALYALGRVSHVGTFPDLEAQMCRMTSAGFDGEGSPDRVDALVWGFTELFPQLTRTETKKAPTSFGAPGRSWMGA